MNFYKIIAIGVLVVGIALLAVGIYSVQKPGDPVVINQTSPSNTQPAASAPTAAPAPVVTSNMTIAHTEEPSELRPKYTRPTGEIHYGNGPYYSNPNNSLEAGVAYKYPSDNTVYIYDGRTLRPVKSEAAYRNFYKCSGQMMVIECAPVYEIPAGVSKPIGPLIQ